MAQQVKFEFESSPGLFIETMGKKIEIPEIHSKYSYAAVKFQDGYIIFNVETGQRLFNEHQNTLKNAIFKSVDTVNRHGNKIDYFIEHLLEVQNKQALIKS